MFTEPQRFAFALGRNQLFSGKGIVKDLRVDYDCEAIECQMFGGYKEYIQRPAQHTLTITMKLVEGQFTDSINPIKFPIRNKYVEDCSIDELLFAIQAKIKNGEQ